MSINWNRRLVPKWGVSTQPVRIFGRDRLDNSPQQGIDRNDQAAQLQEALLDFEQTPALSVAADALRLAAGLEAIAALKPVAKFVVNHRDSRVPDWLKRLALAIVDNESDSLAAYRTAESRASPRQSVHNLRKRLRAYPKNALAWLDYARLQTTEGNNEDASNAIAVALQLAPESRMVIRSAARFHLHLENPSRALFVLNKSARLKGDPWLIAAHIAVTSIMGRSSNLIRSARSLILSNRFRPSDVTELASALATIELTEGAHAASKKLFDISLRAPNDNALAQAEWASRILKTRPDLPEGWLSDPSLAEAAYYRAVLDGQLRSAIEAAHRWHEDEPFASRPLISASFLTAVMGRMYEAEKLSRRGLIAEPNNVVLLNNLVFALTSLGNFEQALQILKKVVTLEGKLVSGQTLANFGFLSYLNGDPSRGAQFYKVAINGFKRGGKLDDAALAAAFHYRAARMAGIVDLGRLEQEARALSQDAKLAMSPKIAEVIIDQKADVPDKKLEQGSLKQAWHFDSDTNLLTFEPSRR